jgi:hypothetical protein
MIPGPPPPQEYALTDTSREREKLGVELTVFFDVLEAHLGLRIDKIGLR